MDIILSALATITPWHWLALALILIGLEIMLGTYDLLWLSGAAFLTAAYAALPVPEPMSGWQAECLAFTIAGIVLLILGRTVFSGLRKAKTDRPNLNQRSKSLVGRTAVAVTDFAGGEGRVKLGDSTWLALAEHGAVITSGTEVRVESVDGTILKVVI